MKLQVGEGNQLVLSKDSVSGDWTGYSRGLYIIARKITGPGSLVNWHARVYPDRRPLRHGALLCSSRSHKLKDAVQEAGVAFKKDE